MKNLRIMIVGLLFATVTLFGCGDSYDEVSSQVDEIVPDKSNHDEEDTTEFPPPPGP